MSNQADPQESHTPRRDPDAFVEYWSKAGGSEGGNAQSFVIDLCHLLDVEPPRPQQEDNAKNNYVFERSVYFKLPDGTRTPGRIDCYKRDCFILEAKQSAKRKRAARSDAQAGLFPPEEPAAKTGHAKRGTRTWDTVMRQARQQAADYARALPVEHGYPPFLLVVETCNSVFYVSRISHPKPPPSDTTLRICSHRVIHAPGAQYRVTNWNERLPRSLRPRLF